MIWSIKYEYTKRPPATGEAWVYHVHNQGQLWGILVEERICHKTLFKPDSDRHDDLDEFIIPLEGCYWVRVGKWARTFSPGEMAVIPRSTDHDSGIATNLPGIRFLVLLFHKDLNVLKGIEPGGVLLPTGALSWLKGAFRYLRHEANEQNFLPLSVLPEYLRSASLKSHIKSDQSHPDPIVGQIIRLLEQPDTPSLESLAKAVGLTPPHLQRRFLQTVGCSPLQYARAWQLDLIASEVTKGNSLPLVELATEYGFNDMKHFRTLFQRRFGMSPAAYRKNHPPQT